MLVDEQGRDPPVLIDDAHLNWFSGLDSCTQVAALTPRRHGERDTQRLVRLAVGDERSEPLGIRRGRLGRRVELRQIFSVQLDVGCAQVLLELLYARRADEERRYRRPGQ